MMWCNENGFDREKCRTISRNSDNTNNMKIQRMWIGYLLVAAGMLSIISCATPDRFIVTGLGYEPPEVKETNIYALPKTGLKIEIGYQIVSFIPGPYADYAQRMLGIDGVKKDRTQTYFLKSAMVETTTEPDGHTFFSVGTLEGQHDRNLLQRMESRGLILGGDYLTEIDIAAIQSSTRENGIFFKDVTMQSNIEVQERTIFKTLITDTSFVRVPVTTQQMERKTIEKKAEEAAKLILEIRSDRYFLSAGLVDPLPASFDIKTAIESLDRLEEEYLSLFIGKSYTEDLKREYYIVPEGHLSEERFTLDQFSTTKGMADEEGEIIELIIRPDGNSRSFRNLLPQVPEPDSFNRLYYRIPEVCTVEVVHADKHLLQKRISIFQSGALVSEKAGEIQ